MTDRSSAARHADLSSLIADPPRDYSPTPLWWWSGEKVTRERVRWQLQQFAAGGIYGVVIINLAPAGPLVGARTDDPVWFSDEWWERFEDACEAASELGMKIWFYDQIGFSGANVQGRVTQQHPNAAGLALRLHRTSVSDGIAQIPPDESCIALFDDAGRRLTVDTDGQHHLADGSDVVAVTTMATAFDYLSPQAGSISEGLHPRRVRTPRRPLLRHRHRGQLPGRAAGDEPVDRRDSPRSSRRARATTCSTSSRRCGRAPEIGRRRCAATTTTCAASSTEEAFFRPLGEWHSERGMVRRQRPEQPSPRGQPHAGDADLHRLLPHPPLVRRRGQ